MIQGVVLFLCVTGCQSQPPTPTSSVPAEKTPAVPLVLPKCDDCIPVTTDNFNRAESDLYFDETIKLAGGIGECDHRREVMSIDKQTIIRANRDTLYSAAVFDLDAGPVTVTLPDAGKRFMSMLVIDEDQYAHGTYYGTKPVTLTKSQVGTRYVMVGICTFVDPSNSQDADKTHALQDAIKVEQKGGPGKFEVPHWDPASQKKVRDALVAFDRQLRVSRCGVKSISLQVENKGVPNAGREIFADLYQGIWVRGIQFGPNDFCEACQIRKRTANGVTIDSSLRPSHNFYIRLRAEVLVF